MIALCATHHAKAHAWTIEQLRAMKHAARQCAVRGRFEWMRDNILAIVGGNYFYETPNMVVLGSEPIIWFGRDSNGMMLLNVTPPSISQEPRAHLVNNDWIVEGTPAEVDSPPSGNFLRVSYSGGDDLSIRFKEWHRAESLTERHPRAAALSEQLEFPLVTCEITLAIGGTGIILGPSSTTGLGFSMTGCVMSRCANGFVFSL